MAQRSILELLLRSKKEGTAAKEVAGDLKELKTASGDAGKAAEKLNLGMLAVKGAAITAGIAFLKGIPALIDLGFAATRAEVALIGLAGGEHEAAEALEGVIRGAGGAIDKMTAATSAAKLFSMGLASNAEEAEKLTKIAITLGAAMGRGPQEAFENFTLLLANQSILRLDTFGISAGAVRERMNELKVVMPELDQTTRFMTATMEQAEGAMKKLDDAGFVAASSYDRFKTKIDDAKISVAQFFSEGLLPWLDGIEMISNALDERNASLTDSSDKIAALREQMEGLPPRYRRWSEAELDAAEASIKLENALSQGVGSWDEWTSAADGAREVTEDVAESTRDVALALGEVSRAKVAAEALKGLNEAWKSGLIDQDQYEEAFTRIAVTMTDMGPAQIDASLSLFNMKRDFADGKTDIDAYIESLVDFSREIRHIPDGKKITIGIDYVYEGGAPEFQHGGSFTVGGPQGIDRTPVFFMASRGEQVTVTPKTGRGSGGDGRPGAKLSIGNVTINRDLDLRAFGSLMNRWAGI
jgi:hypothetical protein